MKLFVILILNVIFFMETNNGWTAPAPPSDALCPTGQEFIPDNNNGVLNDGNTPYPSSLINGADGRLIVGAVGTDAGIYFREWSQGIFFTSWYRHPSGGTSHWPIKFYIDESNNRWVYVKGDDNYIYRSQYTEQQIWSSWEQTGEQNMDFGIHGPRSVATPYGIYQIAQNGRDPLYMLRCTTSPSYPFINGQWGEVMDWSIAPPFMAPQATALLKDGKILSFYYTARSPAPGCGAPWGGNNVPVVWDPATGTRTASTGLAPDEELFCSALAPMSDGKIMVVGGGGASPMCATAIVKIFDPSTNNWTSAPPMKCPRWYPTITRTANGRMLVTSGIADMSIPMLGCARDPITTEILTPEIYNPATNTWDTLPDFTVGWTKEGYPMLYKDQGGNFLFAGPDAIQGIYNANDGSLTPLLDTAGVNLFYTYSSLWGIGKYFKTGYRATGIPSGMFAAIVDTTISPLAWTAVAKPPVPRYSEHHEVVLPTGDIVILGGNLALDAEHDTANTIQYPEIYHTANGSWELLAKEPKPRVYHSTAILLPDGSIFSAGGDASFGWGDLTQFTGAIFKPPYFFKGARPSIISAPQSVLYRQEFNVTTSVSSADSFCLIAPGATTHWHDYNQRRVPVTFTANGNGSFTITAPPSSAIAPPGDYMLFVVSGGLPSIGWWIHLS